MEGGKGTREMWREELTGGGQREVGKRGRREGGAHHCS